MKVKIAIILIAALFFTTKNVAQEVKFGKVSKKELEEKYYPQDTTANAAVLYKKRRTTYEYDGNIGWILVTEIHERIKLYNKDGFENATKKVRLYTQGGKDEDFSIRAYTYNLEGGKVNKTKLEKSSTFNEKITKYWSSTNFTLPNLKEGCIVEWKYSIRSPYYTNINDVICQYNIPIKYLDVYLQIPERFEFKYLPSRYYPLNVKESQTLKNYTISNKTRTGGFNYEVVQTKVNHDQIALTEKIYKLSQKNIPALINEAYVNNINNYRAKIHFEISAYKPKNGIPKFYNTTWKDVTKTIFESQYFGSQLDKKNHFKNDLIEITKGINSQNEKIDIIFDFVKNKMKWNKINSLYTSRDGIKNAYNEGVGNAAEINLTLIAMLKQAGIKSSPILVSTRSHGIPLYPTKDGYNYVIAGIEVQNDVILLDATEKYSLPSVLPLRALNWKGRLIREHGSSTTIDLYPKKFNTESIKLTTKLDEEGSISGMMITTYKNLNALNYRDNYAFLSEDDLISKLETENNDIEIEKIRLNNKNDLSKPMTEIIKFSRDNQVDVIGDKMYISPLLFLTVHENPFKLEERLYPIDYGSAWKKSIYIDIEIPAGYTLASKPEDLSLSLPDNLGTYKLKTEIVNNKINVVSQTKINMAIIGATHYKILKELYKQVIDKQLEKIVLVKGQP